jgi:hypothetical protein
MHAAVNPIGMVLTLLHARIKVAGVSMLIYSNASINTNYDAGSLNFLFKIVIFRR